MALTSGWGDSAEASASMTMASAPPLLVGEARMTVDAMSAMRATLATSPPAAAAGSGFLARVKNAVTPSRRPAASPQPPTATPPGAAPSSGPSRVAASQAAGPSRRPLDRLVALQFADGSWDLTAELAEVVGQPLAALESAIRGATGDAPIVRRALATALALRWLVEHAGESREEWALLEKKALRWLEQCPARPAGAHDWREAAAKFVHIS